MTGPFDPPPFRLEEYLGCGSSRRSTIRPPGALEWEAPAGGCVFPRYLGDDGVEAFCRELVEAEGVVLLPASIYASELGPVPADRFRIGVGRRDPEAALAALGRFVDARG
jgi:hypothetical protein